jgi:hypothetical protein
MHSRFPASLFDEAAPFDTMGFGCLAIALKNGNVGKFVSQDLFEEFKIGFEKRWMKANHASCWQGSTQ